MKERELPPSFWQPPTRIERSFDDICKSKSHEDVFETRTDRISITSPPDTNLLFSLFKILEQSRMKQHFMPKISIENVHPSATSSMIIDEKPICSDRQMETDHVDDVDEDVKEQKIIDDDPYLSLKHEHSTAVLYKRKTNESYSDLLSDLVVNL